MSLNTRSLYTDELLQAVDRWKGIQSMPSKEALARPKGLRVFKSTFLEYAIGRAHPIVPGLWVLPLVAYLVSLGVQYQSAQVLGALMVVGFFSWTLLEYTLHLYLFHYPVTPQTHPQVKFFLFMLHGYHHEYPNDASRLVMPISISWTLGVIVGGALWAAMGTPIFLGYFPGLLLGYLGYDWMHYYEHHIRPTTQAGKYLHEFHAIHHFMDKDHNFGISSPIWDWVFGKAREPRMRSTRQA